MNRIKRVSLFFRVVFQLLFVTWPIVLMMSWVNAPQPLILLHGIIQMNPIPATYSKPQAILHALSNSEKFFGFLASCMPMLIELFILYSLIKLFRMYEKGELFSIHHVRHIRNIGYALLIGQLIEPAYQLLMGFILTINNPPGHRFLAITMDQTNIGMLLTALLVILISWIMAEGFKLSEEQQLTI